MRSVRRSALALALAAITATGCGLRNRNEDTADLQQFELSHDGLDRAYHVYEPESLPDGPVPVVLVLHGGFGDGPGAIQQGRWKAAADEHGFLAVAPEGLNRSWNAGNCCGPSQRRGVDDTGFLLAVLDALGERWDVDADRVFASGISNGGMMAYRLACEASDRVAAIAPVAATLIADCVPSAPVSLLHVHGTDDRQVLLEGGVGDKRLGGNKESWPPVSDGIEIFAKTDDTAPDPETRTDGDLTYQAWTGGRDGTEVELILVDGGGHSWPGGERMSNILDRPSDALDATPAIWRFFERHPREHPVA